MKYYTFAALCAVILVSVIVLSACTQPETQATPFVTGEAVQPVQGCLQLRKEVEDYNAKHPQTPKVADC